MPVLESLPIESFACPSFNLPTVDGCHFDSDKCKSQALLVAFICSHCPYVRAIEDRLIALAQAFNPSELQVVAVCSNDATTYVDDRPEALLARWLLKDYQFPYVIDEAQTLAHSFNAVCTPDLFLFDQDRKLYYHGRLDDNWKDAANVTREELKEAVKGILAHQPKPATQHPSKGCSIKWRS
jgi:thiol-disulfide isomerase/thioredoxin